MNVYTRITVTVVMLCIECVCVCVCVCVQVIIALVFSVSVHNTLCVCVCSVIECMQVFPCPNNIIIIIIIANFISFCVSTCSYAAYSFVCVCVLR